MARGIRRGGSAVDQRNGYRWGGEGAGFGRDGAPSGPYARCLGHLVVVSDAAAALVAVVIAAAAAVVVVDVVAVVVVAVVVAAAVVVVVVVAVVVALSVSFSVV